MFSVEKKFILMGNKMKPSPVQLIKVDGGYGCTILFKSSYRIVMKHLVERTIPLTTTQCNNLRHSFICKELCEEGWLTHKDEMDNVKKKD